VAGCIVNKKEKKVSIFNLYKNKILKRMNAFVIAFLIKKASGLSIP
jgi:hypothetical protein